MNVSDSFISYMSTMRDYYKSGAHLTKPLPIDFTFDDLDIDASSLGLLSNTNPSNNSTQNNSATIKVNTIISNSMKNNEQNKKPTDNQSTAPKRPNPMQTEITTIELFEQDDAFMNVNNKSPRQQKSSLSFTTKIRALFSKLI